MTASDPIKRCSMLLQVGAVHIWGTIGTKGQELVEIHEDEVVAGQALEAVAPLKRRRGYGDV